MQRYSLIILFICLIKVGEIQAQCGKHSVGENMNYSPAQMNEYPEGSTVTFSCLTGYVPVNSGASRSITCRGNQWTTLDLQCKKKSCGSPGEVTNGGYLTPDGIEFGAIITVQCNEGYMSVGPKTRRCLAEGWDGRAAVCEQTKCLPPSKIENGVYDREDESYGYNEVVTYSCNRGYTLIGESSITCSSDGTFQPPPPQCLLIACEEPDIKNAVKVGGKSSSYGYKDIVQYKCNEGYIMVGDGHLVCDVKGWNPSSPQCIDIFSAQCSKPPVGENMIYESAQMNEYPDGSTVTFSCLTGYVPVDLGASRSITCRGNQWTTLDLQCKKKCCGNPGDVSNGRYLTPDGIEFGAIITLQCNEGYMSVGPKTRRCLAEGWDGRPAVCEQTKCLPPSKIENGVYDRDDESYGYGEVVTYSCSKGYTLIGESSITCSSDGTFQPPPPQCLLIACEEPDIKNAVRVGGKSSSYGYKDIVQYKCNEGYIMVGDGHLVCDVKGWNPSPPQCINIFSAQCSKPPVGENMIYESAQMNEYPDGSTVTFSCLTGYVPVNSGASRSITCRGNQWTTLDLQCKKKSCENPGDVSNGRYLTPDGIEFGAIITVECNEG
ncbi:complement receptor type 1-like [Clarias gariepinus]|uniref:complement receptor type 1-like n=1 Tax=Clarias gariepinus TaxID=13013 RepID=UPI00234C6DFE|nr:complement receptor type 1-like [Clarias gariepinus]